MDGVQARKLELCVGGGEHAAGEHGHKRAAHVPLVAVGVRRAERQPGERERGEQPLALRELA